ncbi:MAG TPA: hypothetical protein VEL31_29595 [Ktedonobacteraceae bacterium]|nr:hypothetical protein [Ktedonobacteraceae bacterium]
MNQKSVVPQIISLANSAITEQEQISQAMSASFRLRRLINTGDLVFLLADDAVNAYEKLLEQLLQQERWQEKYSVEYLGKAIQRIIATLLKEEQTAELAGRLFDQLKSEFDTFSKEYVIYTPLEGISLLTDSFPMGKIIFRKMTDAYINDLFGRIKAITLLTLSPVGAKEASISWTKQRIDSLRGTVCAEFSICAEPQRARERAEEEVRHILDTLRYAISVLYSRNFNIAVGLQGEVVSAIRIIPTLALDEQSYELPSSCVGPLQPFTFSSENIQKMEQIGIFKIAEILKHPDQTTDFEKTLLRGIHWFATSQTQFEKENDFLNLMTCLETFLTSSGATFIGPSLANQVAEGVARLLAIELEDRKALKKRIQKLYGVRSGTSHGGQKTILETELADLRSIAKQLIFQMIQRKDEFPTHKALLDWLDEQRLVG